MEILIIPSCSGTKVLWVSRKVLKSLNSVVWKWKPPTSPYYSDSRRTRHWYYDRVWLGVAAEWANWGTVMKERTSLLWAKRTSSLGVSSANSADRRQGDEARVRDGRWTSREASSDGRTACRHWLAGQGQRLSSALSNSTAVNCFYTGGSI